MRDQKVGQKPNRNHFDTKPWLIQIANFRHWPRHNEFELWVLCEHIYPGLGFGRKEKKHRMEFKTVAKEIYRSNLTKEIKRHLFMVLGNLSCFRMCKTTFYMYGFYSKVKRIKQSSAVVHKQYSVLFVLNESGNRHHVYPFWPSASAAGCVHVCVCVWCVRARA